MFLGYCRVSTSEQAADGTTSMQEQERVIRGMAMAKGISAFDLQVFCDAGVSGSIHLQWRPAGRDLLEAVRPGDTVCAAKLDRMFRNSLDALNVYTDFKQRGIHLVLFDLGTQPITDDSGMSKVIFQVMSAFADHERERIRERMLDGKRAKIAKGGHVGGEAPFGFRIEGSKRDSRLVRDEREQIVIEAVAALRELPLGAITKRVNDLGYRTRADKPFDITQIKRILARCGDGGTATH